MYNIENGTASDQIKLIYYFYAILTKYIFKIISNKCDLK